MTITKEKNKDDDNVYDEDKIEVEDGVNDDDVDDSAPRDPGFTNHRVHVFIKYTKSSTTSALFGRSYFVNLPRGKISAS